MNKLGWMTGLASVLLLLAACDRDRITSNMPAIEPEAAAVVPAAPTQPTSQDATPPSVAAAPATVAAPKSPAASTGTPVQPLLVPNLAPPTSAEQRVPQVPVGQADPFAAAATTPASLPAVAVPATRAPAAPPTARAPIPTSPATPAATAARPAPAPVASATSQPAPVAAAPQPQAIPAQVNSAPQLTPQPPVVTVPAAPSAPAGSPTALAEAIAVSGVVQVGEQVSVIVQVPTERTSRYVTVGERIANGSVLVKRIEMGTDVEPVIVLEQNGIEIVKIVGV